MPVNRTDTHAETTGRWETRRDQVLLALGGGTAEEALERLLASHPTTMTAVIDHLRRRLSDAEIVAWMAAPDTWACRGRQPLDLLDDEPETVIEAARHATADTWD
jgi:hypothetical protein